MTDIDIRIAKKEKQYKRLTVLLGRGNDRRVKYWRSIKGAQISALKKLKAMGFTSA